MFILFSWSTRYFSNGYRIWTLTRFYVYFRQYHLDTVQYTLHGLNFLKEKVQTLAGTESPFLPNLIAIINVWTLQVPSCPEGRISYRMSWGDAYSDKNNSLTGILAASVTAKKMCQEVLSWVTWHLSHAVPQLAFLTWTKETSTLYARRRKFHCAL